MLRRRRLSAVPCTGKAAYTSAVNHSALAVPLFFLRVETVEALPLALHTARNCCRALRLKLLLFQLYYFNSDLIAAEFSSCNQGLKYSGTVPDLRRAAVRKKTKKTNLHAV